MKNLKLKFEIALNTIFALAISFNAMEFFVKFLMLYFGKVNSIDYDFGWDGVSCIMFLAVLLISYVIEDLVGNVNELKSVSNEDLK